MDDLPKSLDSVISRDLSVTGGAAVFAGTRVPVQTLLDHLDAGESFDDILVGFPSVRRQQIVDCLAVRQAEVDAAWREEVRRRLECLDSGQATTVPWAEARRRIWLAAGRDPES